MSSFFTKLFIVGGIIILALASALYFSTEYKYQVTLDKLNALTQIDIQKVDIITGFQSWYEIYKQRNIPKREVLTMNLEQKIGQMLFVGINGQTFSNSTQTILDTYNVGGIYLSNSNISDLATTKRFNEDLQKNSKIKLFISTDDDGGAVRKVPWDQTNHLYGEGSTGVSYYFLERNNTPKISYGYGLSKGQSLNEGGFNVNFSPITEGLLGSTSYLKMQGWDRNFDKWIPLAEQIILGQNENISSTMKYFPGTGTFQLDPNKSFQISEMTLDELKSGDLKPYFQIANNSDFVMTSAAKYSKVDDNQVTFSKKFVTDMLKNEINYSGIVISSNLSAEVFKDEAEKYTKTVIAGHDMLFLTDPTQIEVAFEQIKLGVENGEVSEERLDNAVERVLRVKYKKGLIN
ncbi:hypothetical protein IPJ91_02435 [bacterium]|nr:MAG: hypothetical protein IPJ91_02435 [bacterium]